MAQQTIAEMRMEQAESAEIEDRGSIAGGQRPTEHQREQERLRRSIPDVCYSCAVCRAIGEAVLSLRRSLSEAGGDDTREVPDSVNLSDSPQASEQGSSDNAEHHASGENACAYHWPTDECGEFPGDSE